MDKQQALQLPINVSMCAWFRHQGRLLTIALAISIFIAYCYSFSQPITPPSIHNFDLGIVFCTAAFTLFTFFLVSVSNHPATITIEKLKITVKTIPLIGVSATTKIYSISDFNNLRAVYLGNGHSPVALIYLSGIKVDDIVFEPPVFLKNGFFDGFKDHSNKEKLQDYAEQLAALLNLQVLKNA